MIKRIVRMQFQSEHTEQFEELFTSRKEKIAGFEGCHGVELRRDINNPNVYFTVSQWASDEHLQAYRHSELFKETWSQTKVLFSDKPMAWSLSEPV